MAINLLGNKVNDKIYNIVENYNATCPQKYLSSLRENHLLLPQASGQPPSTTAVNYDQHSCHRELKYSTGNLNSLDQRMCKNNKYTYKNISAIISRYYIIQLV